MNNSISRRGFLAAAAAAGVAAAAPMAAQAQATPKIPPVCIFSKHLQFLNYTELAQTLKGLGADGADLTVRPGGHVLPENVAQDLPRAVEALRAEGLGVHIITTALGNGGEDAHAQPILETAGQLGIGYARVGSHKYKQDAPILPQLEQIAKGLHPLMTRFEDNGLEAGYHNHSGSWNVGGPLWDLHRLIEMTGSPAFGSNFDVGHAYAEGAAGAWKANLALIAPHAKMSSLKDFRWKLDGSPEWCALGDGIVPVADMLAGLRKSGFSGPVSIHFEYDTPSRDALLEDISRAVSDTREMLRHAGYGSA